MVSVHIRAVTEAGSHALSSLLSSSINKLKAIRLPFGDDPGQPAPVGVGVSPFQAPRSAPPSYSLHLLPRVHAEQLAMEEERSQKALFNRLSPLRGKFAVRVQPYLLS
jgi:hypothetical protein